MGESVEAGCGGSGVGHGAEWSGVEYAVVWPEEGAVCIGERSQGRELNWIRTTSRTATPHQLFRTTCFQPTPNSDPNPTRSSHDRTRYFWRSSSTTLSTSRPSKVIINHKGYSFKTLRAIENLPTLV